MLAAVAKRLSANSHPWDTVARFGGDEFALLLEEVANRGDARRAALRMAEELRPPIVLGGHEVFVTPSIGIALADPLRHKAEDLLRVADRALRSAKNSGEVYSLVSNLGTTGQALRRLKLEGDLRRAIEREEFMLCYQPEVLLRSDSTVGMEALLRWEHPERGLLSPQTSFPSPRQPARSPRLGCGCSGRPAGKRGSGGRRTQVSRN